jgi:hypothetical protein
MNPDAADGAANENDPDSHRRGDDDRQRQQCYRRRPLVGMLAANRQPEHPVSEQEHQAPRRKQNRVVVPELMPSVLVGVAQNRRRALDVGAHFLVGLGGPALHFVGQR